MEEDVEIDLLLKSNEELLMLHATECDEDESNKKEAFGPDTFNEISGNENISRINSIQEGDNNLPMLSQQSITSPTCGDEDMDCNDMQYLLDDHIVRIMAQEPSEYVNQLYSDGSDEESDEGDQFINEITAQQDQYGETFLNDAKRHLCDKDFNILKELISVHKLVLERDNLLKGLEQKLYEKLLSIEKEILKTREAISLLENGNRKTGPTYSKLCLKVYGAPYIKDRQGFTAPPNVDHKIKLQTGQIYLVNVEKPSFWIKEHQNRLLSAIKETIFTERSSKLIHKISRIESIFQLSPEKREDRVMLENLSKYCKELNSVKNKSYAELMSEEDPDKEYDWMKYSVTLFDGDHSPEECKRFWHVYLKPSLNKSNWDYGEDLRLLDIAEQMEFQDWDIIAKLLGTNRSAYQCFVHFQTRLNSINDLSTGKWTKQEDERLLDIINKSKIGNFIPWTKVASHISNRTRLQIYNRYMNCLDPKIVKGRFTKGEDIMIAAGIEVFDCTYKELSSLLENRTANQIRNRYETYIRPKSLKVGYWTLEEDEKLIKLVEKHGNQNWAAVSKELKVRTRTQVRQRFNAIQENLKRNDSWTIADVKRKNIGLQNKKENKTKKIVEKIKKDLDQIEQSFDLTKLEKNAFRIERLKKIRDQVLKNKYITKKRNKEFSDGPKIEDKLLKELFMNKVVSKPPDPTIIDNQVDYQDSFHELLFWARTFGHKVQLPDNQNEILNNPRLDDDMKKVLLESIKKVSPDPGIITSNDPSLDCVPSKSDSSIVLKQSWCNPLMDLSRLNYSELFKQTIFDYSSGMHRDIWASKMKRTTQAYLSSPAQNSAEPSLSCDSIYDVPPNRLSNFCLKSVLVSDIRLNREYRKEIIDNPSYKNVLIDCNSDIKIKLYEFQKILLTFFTWSRFISHFNTPKKGDITTISESPDFQNTRLPDDMEKKKRKVRQKIELEHDQFNKKGRAPLKRKTNIEQVLQNEKATLNANPLDSKKKGRNSKKNYENNSHGIDCNCGKTIKCGKQNKIGGTKQEKAQKLKPGIDHPSKEGGLELLKSSVIKTYTRRSNKRDFSGNIVNVGKQYKVVDPFEEGGPTLLKSTHIKTYERVSKKQDFKQEIVSTEDVCEY